MNQPRYSELKYANHITLQRRSNTINAKHLCAAVIKKTLTTECRRRKRSITNQKSFELAVQTITAELLIASCGDKSTWAYRSLHKDSFIDQPIKAVTFTSTNNLMKTIGLLDQHKGGNSANPFFEKDSDCKEFNPGLASRFRATPKLLAMAAEYGISGANIPSHYSCLMPKTVIQLRSESRRRGPVRVGGKKIKYKSSEVEYLHSEVIKINEYLSSQLLTGAMFYGYFRCFNLGTQKGYRWNKGGRLFCLGENSYQTMKKGERFKKMKINGEAIASIDVNASYLTIYHGLLETRLPEQEDIYAIPGFHRAIVKIWMVIAFGKGAFPKRWNNKSKLELYKKGISTKGISMRTLSEAICQKLPIMKKLETSGINWADLMFQESRAIINAMVTLRDGYDIPAYSVHDCILVPYSARKIAADVVADEYFRIGYPCKVKIETQA
ncbi:MAG: hypothetical protein O2950_08805 [Proteobacteria bacterium]|mgnify:CR=1 FL=1|jgi:hypothetical protein|nr:hypothetical protein [Pseudomonadota bacterium]MDA1352371.1 hypothetical protein [Pseudomonadota bacterium]|tara:strand:+ start:316 stop:1632 length:1317 start_codon:yes stop_codon:yes gene_type:complete